MSRTYLATRSWIDIATQRFGSSLIALPASAPGGAWHAAFVAMGPKPDRHALAPEAYPPLYSKYIFWDRLNKEILFIAYLNAADDLGVAIGNLRVGDTVFILAADGMAAFAENQGNVHASSIIAAIASGEAIAPVAKDTPESAAIIHAGAQFAMSHYGHDGSAGFNKKKRRDAFGQNPAGNRVYERQEGGVLVCLPGSGGTFYSASEMHPEYWIKREGAPRLDSIRPDHIRPHGFFLIRGSGAPNHNTRAISQDGEMFLVPWAYKFDSNKGYYQVLVKVRSA